MIICTLHLSYWLVLKMQANLMIRMKCIWFWKDKDNYAMISKPDKIRGKVTLKLFAKT